MSLGYKLIVNPCIMNEKGYLTCFSCVEVILALHMYLVRSLSLEDILGFLIIHLLGRKGFCAMICSGCYLRFLLRHSIVLGCYHGCNSTSPQFIPWFIHCILRDVKGFYWCLMVMWLQFILCTVLVIICSSCGKVENVVLAFDF